VNGGRKGGERKGKGGERKGKGRGGEGERVLPPSSFMLIPTLKLYPLLGNIFRKWLASYFLFIHEHLIIM